MYIQNKSILGILAILAFGGVQKHTLELHRIVSIRAENGMFSIDGSNISIFPEGNLDVLDGGATEWKTITTSSQRRAVAIKDGKWQWSQVVEPVSSANDFAFCDPANQVDLKSNYAELSPALPAQARVKTVTTIGDHSNLVIYSTSEQL